VLKNSEVLVLLSKYQDRRTTSTQEAHSLVMNEFTERRNLLQTKYCNLLSFDVENRNGDLVLSPDWISTIFAFNKAEHGVQFLNSLITQAQSKGFHILNDEGIAITSDICLELLRMVNQAEETVAQQILDGIEFNQLSNIIAECTDSINAKEADNEIRTTLSIAKLLSHWPMAKLE